MDSVAGGTKLAAKISFGRKPIFHR